MRTPHEMCRSITPRRAKTKPGPSRILVRMWGTSSSTDPLAEM